MLRDKLSVGKFENLYYHVNRHTRDSERGGGNFITEFIFR